MLDDMKRLLRAEMRLRRRNVPADVRHAVSLEICRRLLDREDVKAALASKGTIAAYVATKDEIDVSSVVSAAIDSGCRVALPAWRGDRYRLAEYSRNARLVPGRMGIPEPSADGSAAIDEREPAVWIVPGLAFTVSGARLGYGGGWYDRFLEGADPASVKLGVAYAFQVVDELPVEPHDHSLTDVVSLPV